MGNKNCDAVAKRSLDRAKPAMLAGINQAMKSTSLGNLKNQAAMLGDRAQSQLDGTYHTVNRDEDAWDSWKNGWYYTTRENFTNSIKEGLDNGNDIPISDSIRQAINSRHQALKATNSYIPDSLRNYQETIQEFRTSELEDFNKLKRFMKSLLTSYEYLFDYKRSVKAIYNEKMNRLGTIRNKIDTYRQNLFMDERKNSYENNTYDFYKSAHFFVLIIYFSLLALYLIFSDFIKEKRYKERKNIIGLISYIITPFLLGYILDNIYKIYIFILEYNNIRDDIISYPYIVNKFNKTDDEI